MRNRSDRTLHRTSIAPLVLTVSIVAFTRVAARAQSATTVISHVTLIDGTGAAPRPDVTVTISDGRIARIAPSSDDEALAKQIDGHGKFLIPGLWDMHVHLTETTDVACPVLVANGVTGVRDMGGDLALVD